MKPVAQSRVIARSINKSLSSGVTKDCDVIPLELEGVLSEQADSTRGSAIATSQPATRLRLERVLCRLAVQRDITGPTNTTQKPGSLRKGILTYYIG